MSATIHALVKSPPAANERSPNSRFSLFEMMEAYGYEYDWLVPQGLKVAWRKGTLDQQITDRLKGVSQPEDREWP